MSNQVEYGIRINVDGERAASTAIDAVTTSTTQLGVTAERTGQQMGAVNGQMNDTAAIMRKNAEAANAASEAAQKFLAPLQREIDLFGASRAEIERYNAAQAGLSATTQRQAAALATAIDAMKRDEDAARSLAAGQDQATQAADAFLKKLNEQVATLGMNAQQLQAYRAAQMGVSAEAAPMIDQIGKATKATHEFGFATARSKTELLVLAHELTQGRFTNFGQSLMVLGEQTGAMSLLFTGAGLAAAGLAVVIGGLAYAAIQGALEQKHMNDALIMTGNYAGMTSDSLNALAHSAVAAGGSLSEAKKVATELAGSGKFTGTQIGQITAATVAWEHATGQSTKSIIADFESLAVQTTGHSTRASEAISRATIKQDDRYHFLTEAVYEQIRALEKEGDAQAASALATETFSKVMHGRAEEIIADLGTIARGWNGVKEAIGGVGDAMGNWGKKATPGLDVAKYGAELAALDRQTAARDTVAGRAPGSGKDRTSQLADQERTRIVLLLTDAVDKLNKADAAGIAQGAATLTKSEAVHAASRIAADDAKLQKKGMTELQVALDEYANDVVKVKASNPDSILVTDVAVAAHIAAIKKAHTAQLKGNDDRAKTLADALVIEQTALDRDKSIYDSREKMLALYHTKMGLSDTDFYAGRDIARTEYVAAEAIAFAREAALITSFQAKNPAEIAANKAKYDQLLKQHLEFTDKMRAARGDDEANALATAKKTFDDTFKATQDVGIADLKRLDDAIAKQKEHNNEIGKSAAQIDLVKQAASDLAAAQLQSDADFIRGAIEKAGFDDAAKAVYSLRLSNLDDEIARRKELAGLLGSAAVLDANANAAADASKAWKRAANTIENDLTNAILDGGGKGWKKLVRDMKFAFAKMILSPILKPISSGIASIINPMASQAAGVLSGVNSAGSIGGSLLSMVGTTGSAISAAGTLFGSAAVGAFGTGLSAGVAGTSVAEAVAAYSAAGYTGVASGLSAGASVGGTVSGLVGSASTVLAAIPVWGWAALAGAAAIAYFSNDGPEEHTRLNFTSNNAAGNISINERGNEGKSDSYIGSSSKSALGTFGASSTFWMGTDSPTIKTFLATVSATDDALAQFMTTAERATVSSSLTGKTSIAHTGAEGTDPNANGELDGVFRERINNILSGLEPGLASLVTGFTGTSQALASEATALLQYRAALKNSGEAVFGAKVTLQELAALKAPTEVTSAALIRITGEFNTTNQVLALLGTTSAQAFGATGLASLTAREQLIQLSGGVAAMGTQAGAFAQNYFSDAERLVPVAKAVDTAMATLGLQTIPTTRAQFRKLIDDLTSTGAIASATGAAQYAGLMSLADAFAQVHPLIEETTAALRSQADILSERSDLQKQLDQLTMTSEQIRAKERAGIDASNLALFDMVTRRQQVTATTTALTSLFESLKTGRASILAYRDSLQIGNLSTLTPMQRYLETQRQYGEAQAKARGAPADSAAQSAAQSAATTFLTASQVINASSAAFVADRVKVLGDMTSLADIAGAQMSDAQQQLALAGDQVTGIATLNTTALGIEQAILNLGAPGAMAAPSFDVGRYTAPSAAGADVLVLEIKRLNARIDDLVKVTEGRRADAARQSDDMVDATEDTAKQVAAEMKDAVTQVGWAAGNPTRRDAR